MQSFKALRVRVALFITVLGVSLTQAEAGFRVVSDVDDTIKITSVRSPISTIWHTLFEMKAFAGMPELYQALMKLEGFQSVDYVSAAPAIVQNRFNRFLRTRGFPEGRLHLRSGGEDKQTYKLRVIRDLLNEFPNDEFILLGDDQELDPTIYFTLFLENPGRIREIYIRSVQQARMPSAVYTFVTAFDVARMEFEFLRMGLKDAEKVALAVLAEKRDRRVLPDFQSCPLPPLVKTENERVIELQKKIDTRINDICVQRAIFPLAGTN